MTKRAWTRGGRVAAVLASGVALALGAVLVRPLGPSTDPATPTTRPGIRDRPASAAAVKATPGAALVSPNPTRPALDAYNRGRYREAEQAARLVVEQAARAQTPAKERRAAVQARWVLAFSAARRDDLALAKTRFALLRTEAARLPDKGKQPALPGAPTPPTFEEEGAYQHAVCREALGDKRAAEAEYLAFVRRFPDSPLAVAALRRVARLHGGDVPPEAKALWRQTTQRAKLQEQTRQRQASLCAPACLAELLRRRGQPAALAALAKEMKTGERGTSLWELAETARRHGFAAEGLMLTQKGLERQRLPLIALVEPGHFVLVEAVLKNGVTVWDPNGKGVGKPDRRHYGWGEWRRVWRGVALALSPQTGALRTVKR